MELRETLARNIRIERAAQQLSQEALGDMSGLTRNYIGSIERCEYSASLDALEAIAKALDVTPAELVTEKKKRRRAKS